MGGVAERTGSADKSTERRPRKPTSPLTYAELHDALFTAHIQPRYQPVVRMCDAQPVGLEVLARMEHPARGTLSPDQFVPPIEDAGLAWPLTQAVIRRAMSDWGSGRLDEYGLSLAINVPLDVLVDPVSTDWIEARRSEADLDTSQVVIELTEGRPLDDLPALRRAAERLAVMGYRLAIDDVGPNVRDHRALLGLPFAILKLDKELVRRSLFDRASADFLRVTIDAARGAGMSIIAEGIEDDATWVRMKAIGVHEAQGFLIAPALPAVGIPAWHNNWLSRHHLARPRGNA